MSPSEERQEANVLTSESLNKQNVLVTGSTGFVGRPLCEKLLINAFSVRGCVRIANAPKNQPSGVQTALIESIGSDTDWSDALTGIDTVIHLAARVHVIDEDAGSPLAEFRRINVAGTKRLARQAAVAGVRRLVFLSSVKVNGEGKPVPYTESDPLAPEGPYGVSKREAEDVLRQVALDTGLEVVIIRPPLVYGCGVKANFLNLTKAVERGLPLPLACITNARSLIYLGNLIDAIVTCAKHPQAAGKTFLVSDGEDVSTPKLVQLLATALDRPARLIPFPPSLIRLAGKLTGKSMAIERLLGSLVVDSSKIRRELGWKPPFTMAEGLSETAKWFKEQC